jgi:hypothetical protein
VSPENLFAHYRAQGARVPRDRANSMQGMACVRRTIDGLYVAGAVTKDGGAELARFQVKDLETDVFDWVAYAAIESGDAFLVYSRRDALAIVRMLTRNARDHAAEAASKAGV